MTLNEEILGNYLRFACRVKDPRILNAVGQVLSAREKGSIEPHASVVTGEKMVVALKRPERLKEIIIIGKSGSSVRIYRSRLRLNRKQNSRKV